jgi:hypothetical protein
LGLKAQREQQVQQGRKVLQAQTVQMARMEQQVLQALLAPLVQHLQVLE